jgi:uncharacterized C2H2 Zn-finger protein
MTSFLKCPRCGYDPNPVYEAAIAAADKYLKGTEEERNLIIAKIVTKIMDEKEKK